MNYLSRSQAQEIDRRALTEYGLSGLVLMENAGRGCAELLMRLNPERQPVVILCGPGNNGGDGFVIARHLDNREWPATVFCPGDRRKLSPDAAANLRSVELAGLIVPQPRFDGWIVDAMFGTGLTRPLGEPFAELVEVINAAGRPVLAIDLPSGLECNIGDPLGPTVRATHTATFVAPKLGFRNPDSRAWTGQVHTVDIGAPRRLIEEILSSSES